MQLRNYQQHYQLMLINHAKYARYPLLCSTCLISACTAQQVRRQHCSSGLAIRKDLHPSCIVQLQGRLEYQCAAVWYAAQCSKSTSPCTVPVTSSGLPNRRAKSRSLAHTTQWMGLSVQVRVKATGQPCFHKNCSDASAASMLERLHRSILY
jgi:hypothetical protein